MESETEGCTNAYGGLKRRDEEARSGETGACASDDGGPSLLETQTPPHHTPPPIQPPFLLPPIFNLPALFLITQNAGEEAACEN